MTHNGEEREKFEKLSLDYMSEESSSDEEGSMTVHKPIWRSNSKFCNNSVVAIVCGLVFSFEQIL